MQKIRNKHIAALIITGVLIWLLGCWAKITHASFANSAITISYIVMCTGCILLLLKTLIDTNDRFLNK